MKKFNGLLLLFLLFAASCKKNDSSPPETPSGITQAVSSQLAKTDSLSTFNGVFQRANLTDADIAQGITVFVVPNSVFGGWNPGGTIIFPDSSALRDYIVKGVLQPADFTNNKSLTTLSGKTLQVTVSGDTIRVNGIIIRKQAIATGKQYAVYLGQNLYNAAGPLSIQVWDATQWAQDKPRGAAAAQAVVSLYASQQDVAAGKDPVYKATADNNGIAVFTGLKPGLYYVVAQKNGANNLFSQFSQPYNGVYLGYQYGETLNAAGGYIPQDANNDGRIDKNDLVSQPYSFVSAEKDRSPGLSVSIGYAFKPLKTVADVTAIIDSVNKSLRTFYEKLVLADGILSDDADCTGAPGYCTYDNFTLTPADNTLAQIWNSGYFSGISLLNYALRDIPGIASIPDDQKKLLIAQAKGMRGYIYLQLMTYFGELPLHQDLSALFFPGISRKTKQEVIAAITSDLTAASTDLPAVLPGGRQALNNAGAIALLAKLALLQRDYSGAAALTGQLISSGAYSTVSFNSWLTGGSTNETIWAPPFSAIGSSNSWYFTNTAFPGITVQYCPVIRYGQVLLMNAEAMIGLNNLSGAATVLNPLRVRDGLPTVTFSTADDARAALFETWQKDMYRQGDRFSNLVRWGTAQQILAANGYHFSNNLLPIPIVIMSNYMGMIQNPGY